MSDLLAQIESYVPANVLIWFAVSSVFMFVGTLITIPIIYVIVGGDGTLLGRGHTQGPGEDHAEITAARAAAEAGHTPGGATLYTTLGPGAFHGRTPACASSIATRGIARVVLAMRDPHPRVDGRGAAILRASGIEVVEGVCEARVRRRLGAWVFTHHPHERLARARSLAATFAGEALVDQLAAIYDVHPERARLLLR